MKISINEVEKIAKLAKLKINEEQKEKIGAQLGNILQYMDKLEQADVRNVDISAGATEIDTRNVLREDIKSLSPGPSVTLANAPERDEDFYVVPGVISNG